MSEVEHSGQIHILGVVAIEEPGERLSLHPQPATDHLFLTGWSYPPQEVKVRILDAWGRIVSSTDHMMAPQDPAMLDVSGLPSGIYRMILSSSTILDSISFVIH
ncbi:MAG: T9SS type A sorting domain-containing protein [Saprospiraceae bacterium]